MTKQKTFIIVMVSCLLCLFLIAGIVFFAVRQQYKNYIGFVIEDTLPTGHGKKAKVVLLAGQSNASGCSIDEYLKKNTSDEEYSVYQTGYDNVYINYFSSGNNLSNGFVKTSTNQGETKDHFGPEVGLSAKLHEMYPDDLFFIIKFAWGGTNLYSQWLSPSSVGKTGYLYNNFVRFVNQNMKYLASKGYDAKIEGVCWMQGESDSFFVETATGYESNLKNFIQDLRKDFSKYAADGGIGFVDAYIAANPAYWVYYDFVNKSKQKVADLSENNVVIDTNAYGLICDQEPEETPDIPHYDSLSQIKLGKLFAEYISVFF